MAICAYFVCFYLLIFAPAPQTPCFGVVSRLFRSRFGVGVLAGALAKLRGVILDRAQLTRVLGAEIPPGVDRVTGVAHDSRSVEPGFAFVAVPGFKRDGAE